MQKQYETWMTFTNSQDTVITFMLEPWGEIYTMEAHATFKLFLRSTIESSPTKSLEIEYGVGTLTVYAWEACIASLFSGDRELN